MKKSIFIRGLAALVACALVLPAIGSLKNPVERPFKGSAVVTKATTNPGGLSGTFEIVGTATHLGKFVSNVSYQVTGGSPDGSKVFVHLWGNFTAANGDTVELEFPNWVLDHSVTPPTSTGVANITGGTGRFANASGSYVANISPADAAPGVTQIWTAEGTISY